MKTSTFECGICKDTGWIEVGSVNAGMHTVVRPCECVEVKRCRKILESSGIAEAFRSKTIRKYDPKSRSQATARDMCIDYVKAFKELRNEQANSIALLGQVGSGKSHLIIAIGNALLKMGIGVIYMQYRETITQLKQTIQDEETFQKTLNRYKNATVLIIDDLFKGMLRQGKANESDLNIMFDLINYRYLKKSPILVSSEYKLKALINFDEAIGSRIAEMCKGRIVEFEGRELNHRMK